MGPDTLRTHPPIDDPAAIHAPAPNAPNAPELLDIAYLDNPPALRKLLPYQAIPAGSKCIGLTCLCACESTVLLLRFAFVLVLQEAWAQATEEMIERTGVLIAFV